MLSTVSKPHVAHLSSASADLPYKTLKNPGISMVSGFFFFRSLLKKFDAVYPIFNGLTMGQFQFLDPNGLTDGAIFTLKLILQNANSRLVVDFIFLLRSL